MDQIIYLYLFSSSFLGMTISSKVNREFDIRPKKKKSIEKFVRPN